MHPDIGIVRMYRRSDSISTRPEDQNTLTHQSAATNDVPRDPLLHGSVINPSTLPLLKSDTSPATDPSQAPRNNTSSFPSANPSVELSKDLSTLP